MRNIAIIDENFDSDVCSSCQLVIQLGEQLCSFAILNGVTKKFIAFKNYWFDHPVTTGDLGNHFRKLLLGDSYLLRQYKSVKLVYLTPVSVLVPAPLFRKEAPEVYFNTGPHLASSDKVLFRKIPAIEAFSVFPVPGELISQVGMVLNDVQFFHQGCPQIEAAISESVKISDQSHILANINPGFVDLMILESGKLKLFNSFVIKNPEDIAFYTLYLYEQFGFSQEETPLLVSGFIELYPGMMELLNRFLRKVVLGGLPDTYSYSPVFNSLTPYHFSQLINLARCE
ncbi:MAG: DUF3822 family protein [Bacteroidales bacterium]|jgi:hypothetical protein